MTYTSIGEVQTVTDADDYTTTYLYDSQGRVTTVQFPNSTTNLYAYDSQGDITKTTDGRGNSTTYSYDAMDRETGETDALGDITTITYGRGRQRDRGAGPDAGRADRPDDDSMLMIRWNEITTHDRSSWVSRRHTAYDADGNQTTVDGPMGRITTTIYDEMDRPVVVIDPMGNAVTTTYDADGETLTVTDALNRTTTYTYSVRGWVATETDPMGYHRHVYLFADRQEPGRLPDQFHAIRGGREHLRRRRPS